MNEACTLISLAKYVEELNRAAQWLSEHSDTIEKYPIRTSIQYANACVGATEANYVFGRVIDQHSNEFIERSKQFILDELKDTIKEIEKIAFNMKKAV